MYAVISLDKFHHITKNTVICNANKRGMCNIVLVPKNYEWFTKEYGKT